MSSAVLLAAAFVIAEAAPKTISVPPKLIAGTITSDDYPPGALARNASGVTKVRLVISAEGRASHCALFETSGHADLDERVCFIVTYRMRFRPAQSQDGQPVATSAILPVRWMLEPSATAEPATPQ